MSKQISNTIFNTSHDLMADFLYYGRKECEDLPMGAIEDAILNGEISELAIIEIFRKNLEQAVENRRNARDYEEDLRLRKMAADDEFNADLGRFG